MRTRWSLAVLIAVSLCPAAADAQVFSEDFDGVATGTLPAGWTVVPAPAAATDVAWRNDDTPGPLPTHYVCSGGTIPPTFIFSAPNALNFNSSTNLENGALAAGQALSPVITVSSTTGLQMSFVDMFECVSCDDDPTFLGTDERFVEIRDAADTTTLLSVQLCVDYPIGGRAPELDTDCTEMMVFHTHTIDLSGLATTSFRIRFRFNQAAEFGLDADMQGWYVDDILVVCADVIPPTTPTNLSPADGTIFVAPPSVTLTWTASTDTSSCGVGAVDHYEVEVDVTNPPVAPFSYSNTAVPGTTDSTPALAPGTYFWRVRAVDVSGNPSADSAVTSFVIEASLPPLKPDTLFVNVSDSGAQLGIAGFVDPVIDETPVVSAIFRDANSVDSAGSFDMEVSTLVTFTPPLDFSLSGTLAPQVAKDARCPDIGITTQLNRDTVYFWRIRFTDADGNLGLWSDAQSFRIGDDFEFGVRPGSSNHSRRCWIATSAWGNADAAPVVALRNWRSGTMELAPAGRVVSRGYGTVGAATAPLLSGSATARAMILPAAVLAQGGTPAWLLGVAGLLLLILGAGRLRRM